jgi:hypothetical protein
MVRTEDTDAVGQDLLELDDRARHIARGAAPVGEAYTGENQFRVLQPQSPAQPGPDGRRVAKGSHLRPELSVPQLNAPERVATARVRPSG